MSNCKARRYSDQMMCECGLAWDMNDPEPPACRAERAVKASNVRVLLLSGDEIIDVTPMTGARTWKR